MEDMSDVKTPVTEPADAMVELVMHYLQHPDRIPMPKVREIGDWVVVEANVEKLWQAGLSDDEIAKLDLRNGGNVDEHGHVLFWDAERLHRKEHPEQELYQDKPDRGDMWEAIEKTVMEAKPENWDMVKEEFKMIVAGAATTNDKPGQSTAKGFEMGVPVAGSTHGTMLPLNVDLTDDERAQSTILPIDLVFQAIDNAEFIAKLNSCICRDGCDCQNYPHDCACLMFNMSGKKVVANRLAREVTPEEAKAEVMRAADLGLPAHALWIEVEELVWGFPSSKMSEFSEICFCCSCCCAAWACAREAGRQGKFWENPAGFTAVVDHDKCTSCKKCSTAAPIRAAGFNETTHVGEGKNLSPSTCPVDAIAYREVDGKCVINQEYCIGCGICRAHCPEDAIRITQTQPMRGSIHEYFLKEGRIDLVMDKCTVDTF